MTSGAPLGGGGSAEWYTPPWVLDLVRVALGGGIDLDPASCTNAQANVKAAAYLTADDDALDPRTQWQGARCFINPPYEGRAVKRFAERLLAEIAAGNVLTAIWLSNAITGTAAGQLIMGAAGQLCFVRRRIPFIDGETGQPEKNPRYDSMIAGVGNVDAGLFAEAFDGLGLILPGGGQLPATQPALEGLTQCINR